MKMVHLKVRRAFGTLTPIAVIFLSLIVITAARSAEDPKIVLLGECNSGKSTLGNIILGQSPYNPPPLPFEICSEVCKKSNGNDLCTRSPSFYEGIIPYVEEKPAVTVVDIPGTGCSGQNDKQLLEDMIQFLRNDVNTTNAFVLTFDGLETHFSLSNIEQLVHEIESTFGFSFWENTLLAVTNWHYNEEAIESRGNHDENWWKDKMNGALQDNFHLKSNLDAVFIDACYDYTSQDELTIMRNEIEKLWDATYHFDPFFLLTFDEMKEQFKNCNDKFDGDIEELQIQIDSLSKIITADEEDIGDLKKNVANLEVNITAVVSEVDDVDQRVSENSKNIDSLSDDVVSIEEDIGDIQTNLNMLENKPRFAAEIRRTNYWLPVGDITDFWTELIDIGNIFDHKTGTLTIKDEDQEGKYTFHVSCHKSDNTGEKTGEIMVYRNGVDVQFINEYDVDHGLQMNSVFTLHLQKGDEVKLANQIDQSILSWSDNPLTFTGYKI